MNKNYIFIAAGTVIALYVILSSVSAALANVVLGLLVVSSAILFFLYRKYRSQIFEYSINFAPQNFRNGKHSLKNRSITVTYVPGVKITVIDNFNETDKGKRTFTVAKPAADIDKIWYIMCKSFGNATTTTSLATYVGTLTPVDLKIINDDIKPKKRVVDRSIYERSPESYRPKQAVPEIVEFNNLQQQAPSVKKEDEAGTTEEGVDLEEFLSMGDVMQKSTAKVNLNTASASEIAVLHGINIVAAKKAVEYRDLNGGFKSIEEFIEVAEVKEHFVDKIKELAVIEDNTTTPAPSVIDTPDEGRLLDW